EAQPESERKLFADIVASAKAGMVAWDDLRFLQVAPFFAGLDTVAHSLAFALYGIVRDRALYARIVDEVRGKFDPSHVTVESLSELDLLRSAVMEAMRMWPVTPIQIRQVKEDCTVGGFNLRAGERVMYG